MIKRKTPVWLASKTGRGPLSDSPRTSLAIFNPSELSGSPLCPPPPHFSFHVDTGRVSDKLFFIFYYVRVCLRRVVRRAPPRQGKKLSRDQRETRPGVTQTGRGVEVGGGGLYEVRQNRGIEIEGKKKMV